MRRSVNLNRLAYFATVVEAGSFTRAAERLGVTKAVVSQQVSRLEEEMGVALLVRTTRQLYPTEAGSVFYERCAALLHEAEDAVQAVTQDIGEPTGTLRLTAPFDYGAAVVAPAIAIFRQRHPQVEVEAMLSDTRLDIVAARIDVSIRVGWLADSSNLARRIGTFRQCLVGIPDWVSALACPEDVEALPWVANTALPEPRRWSFLHQDGGETRRIEVRSGIAMDTTMAVHACVRAGAGLSVLPDFLVADDLAAGRLVQLLPDWTLPSGGIHVVFPQSRFRPAKVRAFVRILEAAVQRTATTRPSTLGATLPLAAT
ncbi:putative transcriptional regulator, LysR family protein [Paramagnetospirillum caucaseum]|uniref:Putative transcriptional regulator, LysR family protein n=1 Tax=Paramagnetospirillum caucaseum TaxID=1244869 RepID=M2ZNS4_9PROT|nr:LysR family transcriptional regulator [Paramagnetospirillum caucaseum]EME68957.1 putative transcriptional regulator, LysR family protein [Paramagnetospirillum caucaseum]